jgi:3D (Asp-Asp-Asp) domain-containing protein
VTRGGNPDIAMHLSRSIGRKIAVTIVVMIGFVLLYEATMFDAKHTTRQLMVAEERARPAPPSTLRFSATAYCKGTTTASGVSPRRGIAAADPDLLPVGSVIQIVSGLADHNGIYTIMDTGPRMHGRNIDIYMWSCNDALRFGKRGVEVIVLRRGWSPQGTLPLFDALPGWVTRRKPLPASPTPAPAEKR